MRHLLISLGGSDYPDAPDLRHSAFQDSSLAVSHMLKAGKSRIVDDTDHLDLFGSGAWWPQQLVEIRNWVAQSRNGTGPGAPTDIILHYVGHGAFLADSNEYYLTINRTDRLNPFDTSLTLTSLYRVLSRVTSRLRVYILIDACFAAAALKDMMLESPAAAVSAKVKAIMEAQPIEVMLNGGLALLCSSDKFNTSSARGHSGLTQFTDGLLTVVENGDPNAGQHLSLGDISRLLRNSLRDRYGDEAVLPILHAPESERGGIGNVNLIPNRAISDARALLHGLDDDLKAELAKRVAAFLSELQTALPHELNFERHVDMLRGVGASEVRSGNEQRRMAEGLRAENTGHREGDAFASRAENLNAAIDRISGLGRIAELIPLRFVPTRLLVRWLRQVSTSTDTSLKVPISDIRVACDQLLIFSARLDTVRETIWKERQRSLQMVHTLLLFQAHLQDLLLPGSALNQVSTTKLRSRALPQVEERLRELTATVAALEQESDRLLAEKDANFSAIKKAREGSDNVLQIVRLASGLARDLEKTERRLINVPDLIRLKGYMAQARAVTAVIAQAGKPADRNI
jgi:outer membrane murein-binding lipoprotein Lpp